MLAAAKSRTIYPSGAGSRVRAATNTKRRLILQRAPPANDGALSSGNGEQKSYVRAVFPRTGGGHRRCNRRRGCRVAALPGAASFCIVGAAAAGVGTLCG